MIPGEPGSEAAGVAGDLAALAAVEPAAFECYREEIEGSAVFAAIARARREFQETVGGVTARGCPYGFGGMRPEVCERLYALVRMLRPSLAVETGVCNGASTAAILAALVRNGLGALYSIDLPEFVGTPYPLDAFWAGKKGAAVPRDKSPGWVVPEELRSRWDLTLGRSQEVLRPLLERLGAIDFFLHDSEHSYECMTFEYEAAWSHLRAGGILASDDIRWNTAFEDFARRQGRPVHALGPTMGFVVR